MIVIDFDGVLFDDVRFKRDYVRMFGNFGVSKEEYGEAYETIKRITGGWYIPNVHISALKKRYPLLETAALKKETLVYAARAKKYLYADAKPFLRRMKLWGEKVILLSTGQKFQKRKIAMSGIKKYFDGIKVIRQSSKLNSIRTLGKKQRLIFLDDKKEVVDEIKRAEPAIVTIQVRRRAGQKKSILADTIVKNLREAETVLKIWK